MKKGVSNYLKDWKEDVNGVLDIACPLLGIGMHAVRGFMAN